MEEVIIEKDIEDWAGISDVERGQKMFPGQKNLSQGFKLEMSTIQNCEKARQPGAVTKNSGSSACCKESQTPETGAGAK